MEAIGKYAQAVDGLKALLRDPSNARAAEAEPKHVQPTVKGLPERPESADLKAKPLPFHNDLWRRKGLAAGSGHGPQIGDFRGPYNRPGSHSVRILTKAASTKTFRAADLWEHSKPTQHEQHVAWGFPGTDENQFISRKIGRGLGQVWRSMWAPGQFGDNSKVLGTAKGAAMFGLPALGAAWAYNNTLAQPGNEFSYPAVGLLGTLLGGLQGYIRSSNSQNQQP